MYIKISVYPIGFGYRVEHEVDLRVGILRTETEIELQEILLGQLGRLLDEGVVAHAHDAVGIRLRDVREEGVDVLIVQKRAVERIRNPLAA